MIDRRNQCWKFDIWNLCLQLIILKNIGSCGKLNSKHIEYWHFLRWTILSCRKPSSNVQCKRGGVAAENLTFGYNLLHNAGFRAKIVRIKVVKNSIPYQNVLVVYRFFRWQVCNAAGTYSCLVSVAERWLLVTTCYAEIFWCCCLPPDNCLLEICFFFPFVLSVSKVLPPQKTQPFHWFFFK